MCACVRPDRFQCVALPFFFFAFFLKRGPELLLRQESLITSLPVPERAGASLSGVNEMNFSRHRVGGLAAAPEMCVF